MHQTARVIFGARSLSLAGNYQGLRNERRREGFPTRCGGSCGMSILLENRPKTVKKISRGCAPEPRCVYLSLDEHPRHTQSGPPAEAPSTKNKVAYHRAQVTLPLLLCSLLLGGRGLLSAARNGYGRGRGRGCLDHAHEMAVPAVVLGQLCAHERGGLQGRSLRPWGYGYGATAMGLRPWGSARRAWVKCDPE